MNESVFGLCFLMAIAMAIISLRSRPQEYIPKNIFLGIVVSLVFKIFFGGSFFGALIIMLAMWVFFHFVVLGFSKMFGTSM